MLRSCIIAVAVIALSACSGATVQSAAVTLASTPDTQPPPNLFDAGGVETASIPPTSQLRAPGSSASAVTTALPIEAQTLPREVSSAIRDGGGELATTESWVQRFAPIGMPLIDGVGVHLVEADLQVTRTDGGWRRVDAMQWLYVDPADIGVAATLDQLAVSANIADWGRVDDSVVIDTAPCMTRTFTAEGTDESWILQGCEFPAYPGMVSIGVTHSTAPSDVAAAASIDPSIAQVLAESGGTIEHVIARFAPPATVASTATLTSTVTITPGIDAVGDRLAATALAGWSTSPGEANSTVFIGSPGQSWTVTPNTIRFSSQGSLTP